MSRVLRHNQQVYQVLSPHISMLGMLTCCNAVLHAGRESLSVIGGLLYVTQGLTLNPMR